MALITRLTRLFRADVHAVLDRMEEPDVLLAQAVREMEDDAANAARELKARELELGRLRERAQSLAASLASTAGEIDLCFVADNEPLVRTLLRRRLEGERLATHLAQRIAAAARDVEERRTTLAERERKLEAMRQKAALFAAEPRRDAEGDAAGVRCEDFAVTDDDIEVALLRERQKRSAS
jgi:phage shock protein A